MKRRILITDPNKYSKIHVKIEQKTPFQVPLSIFQLSNSLFLSQYGK